MHRFVLLVICVASCISDTATADNTVKAHSEKTTLLGFEQGNLTETPRDWLVMTEGWKAELSEADATDGKRSAKLFLDGESSSRFGILKHTLDITPFHGKRIRLSAKLRVEGKNARGRMWLRVDRPDEKIGLFDTMSDRPVSSSRWTSVTIEGDVDTDGVSVVCGFITNATIYIDEVEISVLSDASPTQATSPPRSLTDREVENLRAAARLLAYVRFFHPSDECLDVKAWDHFTVDLMNAVETAANPSELAERLRNKFHAIGPGLTIWAGDVADGPAPNVEAERVVSYRYWVHQGAGLIAAKSNIYYSQKKVFDRDKLGTDPQKPKGLFGVISARFAGDHEHYRPETPFLTKSLGAGVFCRLPVLVPLGSNGSLPKAKAANPWKAASSTRPKLTAMNRATRLAGVAICWGVVHHFYPYFDVVDTDWDAALTSALRQAAEDVDERSYLYTLQKMIAKLHDGHGRVFSTSLQQRYRLPLELQWASGDLVVIGKHGSVKNAVDIGDAIIEVDGRPLSDVCGDLSTRISAATDGHRRVVLKTLLTKRFAPGPCRLRMRKPNDSTYAVDLRMISVEATIAPSVTKPENGTELCDGIVYFDLSGTKKQDLDEMLERLKAAKGIVFDLRGYPADAAQWIIPRLTRRNVKSPQWNVPVVTLPDRDQWHWRKTDWTVPSIYERLDADFVFLTDGRAISAAETFLSIMDHYQLGEIVGATTAGTNGNINPFSLPGGFRVTWTGMKVLKHDGTRHHGVGIAPAVPVEPTAKGIAAGRDEVLEKGIEVLKNRIRGDTVHSPSLGDK